MKRKFIIFVFIFCFSCEKSPEYTHIFSYPSNEWDIRSSRLPDDQLIDAFVYGIKNIRPPVVLVEASSARSRKFFIKLSQRVKRENNDYVTLGAISAMQSAERKSPGLICNSNLIVNINFMGKTIKNEIIRRSFLEKQKIICHL